MKNDLGERWCDWCGDDIPADAAPQRKTCSDECRRADREYRKAATCDEQDQARSK